MFCTQCQTAWSWDEGTIEHKIHNPHYFQMMREGKLKKQPERVINGRDENGFMVCFDLTQHLIRRVLYVDSGLCSGDLQDVADVMSSLYRAMVHVREYEIRTICSGDMQGDEADNERNRIRYIRQEIDEAKFISLTRRAYRAARKARTYKDILNAFANSLEDILKNAIAVFDYGNQSSYYDMDALKSVNAQVDTLIKTTNQFLAEVSKTYKSVQYRVCHLNMYCNLGVRNVKHSNGFIPELED